MTTDTPPTAKQTGDKPMVTQRAIELLERAHAKGGLGYEAHGAIEYAINVLRHRAQETLSPEQPRPCAVCGDGLTTQMGASLKSKAESAATWMRRAATAEIELIQAREGLQKIATGGIDGEPSNSRDTLHIVRQIATDTLTALSPSPDLAEENERLREALEAIQLSGIHRDAKWAGMNAHDIARATLQSISTGNP